MNAFHQFRQYVMKPHVRPWALSAPILVLLICLPLLRPLRHPDPREISDSELNRLATVQSLVEHRTLAINGSSFKPTSGTIHKAGQTFSAQPPTMAVLLAGPYCVMRRFGLTFDKDPSLVEYLLTMLGVTIPVALAAGFMHHMGRIFELRRPIRAMLAIAVALGSGMVSYAVVLNAYAPAAALIIAAVSCFAHVAVSNKPRVTSGWVAVAGLCAALAATIDPAAVIFLVLFVFAIFAMRWRVSMKVGGVALYLLGAAGPLILHGALVTPITGDFLPPQLHREMSSSNAVTSAHPANLDDIDDSSSASWWDLFGMNLARVFAAFFGTHGILTHFPIVLLGIVGVAAVMHRHWPMTTKTLATATVVGACAIILVRCVVVNLGAGEMFGPQAFIVFLPLMLFWSGAWVRRQHHPATWVLAGCLLLFSVAVGLIGATNPCPRDGYERYTVAQALGNLVRGDAMAVETVIAGR